MALSSSGTVQNTKKPNAENPNLKFVLNAAGTKYLEFRRAGSSSAYGVSAVFHDGDTIVYNDFYNYDGTYIAGRILNVQEIIINSNIFVDDKEVWEFTVDFSPVAGAKRYLIIPKTINYGAYMNLDYSGNTISVRVLNLSGENHSMAGRLYVIALNL